MGSDDAMSDCQKRLQETFDSAGLSESDVALLTSLVGAIFGPESQSEYREIIAPSYVSRFSEKELDDLINIANSPVFQKYTSLQPEIREDVSPKISDWVQKKIVPMLEEFVRRSQGGVE